MTTTPASVPLVFDLETHSADEQWDGMHPSRFVRLAGYQATPGEEPTITDYAGMVDRLRTVERVGGHNLWNFDLWCLGFSKEQILQLARENRVMDTWTWAPLLDSPPSYRPQGAEKDVWLVDGEGRPRMGNLIKFYGLDNLDYRYGGAGKTHDLTDLARPYRDGNCCGYGNIPLNDPDYRTYLAGDVAASRRVLQALVDRALGGQIPDYYWREQRVAAIAAVVAHNAFRPDIHLTQQRDAEGHKRSEEYLNRLADRYGLAMTNAQGKPASKPLATAAGKETLRRALEECGHSVAELPRTDKGNPSFGGKGFLELAESDPSNPALAELAEAVGIITGERAVYGTVLKYLRSDGLSHPRIFTLQRSGRWSSRDPGITVFGKRNGRVVEREVYIPDVTWEEAGPECHVLMTVDAAQIDARAVAGHSQDYDYMDMFEGDRDSHSEVAIRIWGDAARADLYHYRELGKPMHHGSNYGLGANKMNKTMGIPLDIAQYFLQSFKDQFPRLEAWKSEVREQGQAHGVLDNGFGRLMRVDPDRAYTQAPALMGQGTARDLMMEGLLRLPDDIVCMIKAQIHDEIVLSVPMRHAKEIRDEVVRCLTFEWCPPHGSRPIKIEADAGKFGINWARCYDK